MRISPVTISIAFVNGLMSGLCAKGVPCEQQLAAAGISSELLTAPEGRVTADQYVALYQALQESSKDESVGLFSRPLRPGSLALVMRGTLVSSTLESALWRLGSGLGVIQDDAQFALIKEKNRTGLHVVLQHPSAATQLMLYELLMRVCSRFIVWLHGGHLEPLGFDFPIPSPHHADEYFKLFPGEVQFDQPQAVMWFKASELLGPVRRDDAALRDFMAQTMRNVIQPHRHDAIISKRVRAYLQQSSPQWPDLPATAVALHMSMSSLQKHLATEETSFQIVKDHLRRDMAIMRLNTSNVSLTALAGELGFSDPTVFQRAFKIWTGSPPGAYRQQLKR